MISRAIERLGSERKLLELVVAVISISLQSKAVFHLETPSFGCLDGFVKMSPRVQADGDVAQ